MLHSLLFSRETVLRISLAATIVLLGLLLTCAQSASGQGSTPGEKLYWEAVALHGEFKHSPALEKIKAALKQSPKNSLYAGYLTELEGLVAQDTFDRHALRAPADAEKSVEALAAYLVKPAKNDHEKARLLFRWVTDRVTYDEEAARKNLTRDQSVNAVLRSRKATCGGFCNLYERLCKLAGLEVVTVQGYCKGFGTTGPQRFADINHAWNAVKIDKQWLLADGAWACGVVENDRFVKRYREFFYAMAPDQLVFSHLPKDPKWQMLPRSVAKEEFEAWPLVSFHLFEMGVKADAIRAKLQDKESRGFVQPGNLPPGPKITLLTIPLDRNLRSGTSQTFRIEAPGVQEMAFHDGKQVMAKLTQKGAVWEGSVTPQKGKLIVVVRIPEKEGKYRGLLSYDVE